MPKVDEDILDKILDEHTKTPQDREKHLKMIKDVLEDGKTIAQSLAITPNDLEWVYEDAQQLYQLGDYKRAIMLFHYLCVLDDKNARYWFASAACNHRLKKYEKAYSGYYMASFIQPKNPINYYHLADCQTNNKEFTRAHFNLVKCIERCGDEPKYEALKARALGMLEQIKDKPVSIQGLMYNDKNEVIGAGNITFKELWAKDPNIYEGRVKS